MDNRNSDPATAIRILAQSFPCLWNAPGVRPWEPLEFDGWASSGGPSHGEVCTARFLLAVWDPNNDWKAGRFMSWNRFGSGIRFIVMRFLNGPAILGGLR